MYYSIKQGIGFAVVLIIYLILSSIFPFKWMLILIPFLLIAKWMIVAKVEKTDLWILGKWKIIDGGEKTTYTK